MDGKSENENNLNVIRHTNPFKDPIIVNNMCRHKSHGMFYMCPDYEIDYHLHCISCGKILPNDITLRTAARCSKLFMYRYSCKRLCDHLPK